MCDTTEAQAAAEAMASANVSPVFRLSCTSGEGVELLRTFMSRLVTIPLGSHINSTPLPENIDADHPELLETEYYLDHAYLVPGVGIVVGGSLLSGRRLTDERKY